MDFNPPHKPNQPYHSLTTRLSSLPPELIHQVLTDLALPTILTVLTLTSKPPFTTLSHLDSCFLTHPLWSKALFAYSKERVANQTETENEDDSRNAAEIRRELLISIKQRFHAASQILNLKCPGKANRVWIKAGVGDVHRHNTFPWDGEWMISMLQDVILKRLLLYRPYLDSLSPYFPEWDPDNDPPRVPPSQPQPQPPPRLGYDPADWVYSQPLLWKYLRHAELAIQARRSNQLSRLAGLLTRHPRLLRFKLHERGKGVTHAINQLNVLSRKLVSPHLAEFLQKRVRAGYIFRVETFPLIPHDVVLRGFLKVLAKFPFEGTTETEAIEMETTEVETTAMETELPIMSTNMNEAMEVQVKSKANKKAKIEVLVYPYPQHIVEKLRRVTSQMDYYHPRIDDDVYTISKPIAIAAAADYPLGLFPPSNLPSPPPAPIRRTEHTRYSAAAHVHSGGLKQPHFVYPPESGPRPQLRTKTQIAQPQRPTIERLPLQEKEFVWLEEFLECCDYFAAGMGKGGDAAGEEVEMVKGVGLREWWRKHVLE